ncbi:hypothetical protein HMPREF9123_0504 [Neisseria bacilliformis ATCC BAA-1200]|uniref:Uncharacterized protein n=1 Tax=Neisseria bacilliformis ATCC BAA-1200 TaxID=888742 RepID=F2B9V0_9NEIS|nr:hypothetical protein HMPREF9123_0504 [Neisseria bacilliformis ATCC BAA-1200]
MSTRQTGRLKTVHGNPAAQRPLPTVFRRPQPFEKHHGTMFFHRYTQPSSKSSFYILYFQIRENPHRFCGGAASPL